MKIFKFLLFLLLGAVFTTSYAQDSAIPAAGTDPDQWMEYIAGNMPLVISVPHGGTVMLPGVSPRNCTGAVTVTDNRTIELAREIQKAFLLKYQKSPFIIICHLSRKLVDQNRDIENGTCGNVQMREPWQKFHDEIDTALAASVREFGFALYIDLHGHGHPNQRLELGYGINASDLPSLDSAGDLSGIASRSSLANLLRMNPGIGFREAIAGSRAFGTLISSAGTPAVPSQQDVAPAAGEKYFNGGYNTRRYTSDSYPFVFGWQIESNYKGVRDPTGRPLFARRFAGVIMKYLELNSPHTKQSNTQHFVN